MPLFGHLVAFVIAVATAGLVAAQDPTPPPAQDQTLEGETAPAGRWYTAGGAAARCGASANPPLLHQPQVRWRIAIEGELVGEPLVWDDRVVLAVRVNDKRRQLQVRALGDGHLVAERTINSTADTCPSLWGNEVVSRIGVEGLELQRFTDKVTSVAQLPRKKLIGPPLRIGANVYVVLDGALCCLRASDFRQLWIDNQGRRVGAPSIFGNRIYSLCAQESGYAVAVTDRASGTLLGTSTAVKLNREPGDGARIVAARAGLQVMLDRDTVLAEFSSPDGVPLNSFTLPLECANKEPQPTNLLVAPAIDRHWQLLAQGNDKMRHLLLLEPGADKGIQLDANESHRALAGVPPTLCGGVAYFGACAVALDDRRVLWRLLRSDGKPLPTCRAVPAGRTLLLADAHEIVALGDDVQDDPIDAELAAARAEFERTRLATCVDDAIAVADWDLALDCLARCRALAIDAQWADKRDKDIAARSKKKVAVDAKATARRAEIRSSIDELPTAAVAALHTRIADWAASRPPAAVRRGLRTVLAAQPDHAAATAMVRAMIPKDLPVPEPFRAADWLDFLDAIEQTHVDFLTASPSDFADSKLDSIKAQSKQQLLQWRQDWRPDLQALQSGRLLVFSSVTAPGSIAKALSAGELVCDTLEQLFADLPQIRQDPRPMLVFLYSERKEYLAEAEKGGFGDVAWTAGFYSDSVNELVSKSRLFVPADDTGFATVLPTLAHELTHHWLMDRCRAFHPDKGFVRVAPSAFWIVEGFASMIEQFAFDLEHRRAHLGGGDLNHADLVASAQGKQLLDWDDLVRVSHGVFLAIEESPQTIDIPSSLRLGAFHPTRAVNMFYAQSAMLCRYLFEAEGGAHRRALLDYIAAFYTGKGEALDFAKAFGAKASAYGPKVAEFSRSLVR